MKKVWYCVNNDNQVFSYSLSTGKTVFLKEIPIIYAANDHTYTFSIIEMAEDGNTLYLAGSSTMNCCFCLRMYIK